MLHLYLSHLYFYLDPGSGSFILQMLVAGVLGGGLAVSIFFNRIKSKFNKKPYQIDHIKDHVGNRNDSK